MRLKTLAVSLLSALAVNAAAVTSVHATIAITPVGTYQTGVFDQSAAEIVKYDPETQRLFVVKATSARVDVLDISDPSNPAKISDLNATAYGAGVNSVSVHNSIVALAVEAADKTQPGKAVFFSANGFFLSSVTVGALPDMITFTPDGNYVLTANEGEPKDYCQSGLENDPEGSISIIDMSPGVTNITNDNVATADFHRFEGANLPRGVRVTGPDATVSQDFEPEYITVSPDSAYAYVTLQENNAIAVVNIARTNVEEIIPLGYKDHSKAGKGLDVSDKDGGVKIGTHPVFGMYQPDTITSLEMGGQLYLITANEGDSREYECALNSSKDFEEAGRVKDLALDPTAFPDARTLKQDSNLGRLQVSTVDGDTDGDGDYDALYAFGGRSFSIWAANGQQVYDSGDRFEQITAELYPLYFNADSTDNARDNRSDNKGPEPEAVTVGTVGDRTYAFIGLERIGGIMVWDITEINAPSFVQYFNNRNFDETPDAGKGGDLAPESILFISAEKSPNGVPLLVVANEVSGSTTIYEVQDSPLPQDVYPLGVFQGDAFAFRTTVTSGDADLQLATSVTGMPVMGDWLGLGSQGYGLFDATTNQFYLWDSLLEGPAQRVFQVYSEEEGLIPLAGDWNGDGQDTVGYYQPATATFTLQDVLNGNPARTTFTFGPEQSWPLVGDWDQDGVDTVGVYDYASGQFLLRNSNDEGSAELSYDLGLAGFSEVVPMVGDWGTNGLGLGLYLPTYGVFNLAESQDQTDEPGWTIRRGEGEDAPTNRQSTPVLIRSFSFGGSGDDHWPIAARP